MVQHLDSRCVLLPTPKVLGEGGSLEFSMQKFNPR